MPGRYSTRRRRFRPMVNTIKNSATLSGSTGTTIVASTIAIARASPDNTVSTDVENGCRITAIWISVDVCGLDATDVLQTTGFYLMKNPGNNLTPPTPFGVGLSNEKRFVIKEWNAMTMRNQDGNPPYHWEGWIKVPRVHQRMGTDDRWEVDFITSNAAGHFSLKFLYKWQS